MHTTASTGTVTFLVYFWLNFFFAVYGARCLALTLTRGIAPYCLHDVRRLRLLLDDALFSVCVCLPARGLLTIDLTRTTWAERHGVFAPSN